MAFYLVGLGLWLDSVSNGALNALKKCEKVYLDGYTVKFPYSLDELRRSLGLDFELRGREQIEDESIVLEAREKDVALMVYGDPLFATTHYQLLVSCNEAGVKRRVFHNASVLDAVSLAGLSLYKFGKVTSVPDWRKHTNCPTSFVDYILDNQKVQAHSLVLFDIGLEFERAVEQIEQAFEKKGFKIREAVLIFCAGTPKERVFYGEFEGLKNVRVEEPYCIVIPANLNDFEKRALEEFKVQ
ncbi:diphthine synthase [Candidatus Pacearchaeota archaeon]|nr:MAG: diphthine synthase [Candidatus Pacearchaeota archaeon]